jgi:hypothetical protein
MMLSGSRAAPARLRRSVRTLAEQLALGEHRERRGGEGETLVQRGDGDGECLIAREEGLPAVDVGRLHAGAAELFDQRLAAAGGIGGDERAARVVRQEMTQRRAGLLALAAKRQFRRGLRAQVHGVLVAFFHHVDADLLVELLAQVLWRQVDLRRRQHGALDIVRTLVVSVAHLLPERGGRFEHAFAQHEQGVIRDVFEQGFGLGEEQRQVVLDAAGRHAFLHVLVQRAPAHVDGESVAQGIAERLGRFVGDGEFAGGEQVHAFHLLLRALCFGVERADRFDLVVEELDAVGLARAHGVDIDERAADGEVARLGHLGYVAVAGRFQAALLGADIELLPLAQHQARARDVRARRDALHERGHRHHQHAALHRRQAVQRGDALRHHLGVGAEDVVGQGFPIGEVQHGQFAREHAQLAFEVVGAAGIAHHDHQQAIVCPGRLGHLEGPGRAVGHGPVAAGPGVDG